MSKEILDFAGFLVVIEVVNLCVIDIVVLTGSSPLSVFTFFKSSKSGSDSCPDLGTR